MRLIYKLRVRKGPDRGLVYDLSRKETVIGRGEDCDLPLSDNETSRRHCKVVVRGRKVEVMDMGSTNGTRHNDRIVDKSPLSAGDVIGLGSTELLFFSEEASESGQESEAPGLAQRLGSSGLAARIMGLGWSSKIIAILLLLAMASYLLVAAPLISRQTDVLRRAGLKLSEVLVLSLAGANQEALRQGDEMMINVKQMAGVEGVTAVYVYDLAGRTLAPVSQLHKVPADPTSQAALAADKVLIQPLGDDVYDLAAPIRVFNIKAGKFQKVGTARVVISLKELEGLSREAWLASLVSLILMLACAAAAGLLISRVTYRPINDLRMELEAALKGDQEQVTPARGFGPLVGLAESLNRAVAKLDKAAAPAPAAAPAGPPAGARAELKALVRVSPGAVLAADADNQVIYASPAYCRAMRVEASQVEGGHLLEAVGDKKLLAALLELVKQSLESGGEPRSGAAVMDDGAQVEMTACAVAGPGAEPGAIAISFQGLGQEAAS